MAYYRETAPHIGYYFAQGKLCSLDGMASIDEVQCKIERYCQALRLEKCQRETRASA
jgi:adenylate kinase family enzyme